MCLAAVAHPCFDTKRRRMCDGKLGIWPFAHQVPAKNNSKNRPKSMLEWKGFPATKNGAVDASYQGRTGNQGKMAGW